MARCGPRRGPGRVPGRVHKCRRQITLLALCDLPWGRSVTVRYLKSLRDSSASAGAVAAARACRWWAGEGAGMLCRCVSGSVAVQCWCSCCGAEGLARARWAGERWCEGRGDAGACRFSPPVSSTAAYSASFNFQLGDRSELITGDH